MINYAVSLGSFTYFMTDEVADALRRSKFSRVELAFLAYTVDDERSHKSYQLTRDMIKKGEIIKKLPQDELLSALKYELDNWR